ncbi:MAG: CoA-binding protein [Spirochaetales bacterium]|nr:CoA-binding protein [Spirochaetales bacterium]
MGATTKPERYANIAQKLLMDKGYNVYPINPNYEYIENAACSPSIKDVKDKIDTVTVYMNPKKLESILSEIISIKPKRIILNPGSESEAVKDTLNSHGIAVMEACTLVLLKTGQF